MLILARRPGERVLINTSDGEIVVTLVGERKGQMRLGFDAPEAVVVNREEVQAAPDAGEPYKPHPAGIDLSPISSDHDYRHLSADQRAVREALTEVAAMLAEQMADSCREWSRATQASVKAFHRTAYLGQNWSLGCVLRVWERHGFKGQPLDNMPPEEIDDQTKGGA